MTRETFSRTLAVMTRYGLAITGDSVEVTDADALRARFQLDPLIDAPEPIMPLAPHLHLKHGGLAEQRTAMTPRYRAEDRQDTQDQHDAVEP